MLPKWAFQLNRIKKKKKKSLCTLLVVLLNYSCLVGNLLQPIRMTNLICLVTRHLYGISSFVPQTSFCRETVIDIAKIMSAPFSGKPSIKFPLFFYAPGNANDCSARGVRGVFPIMTYMGKLLIKEVTFSVKNST